MVLKVYLQSMMCILFASGVAVTLFEALGFKLLTCFVLGIMIAVLIDIRMSFVASESSIIPFIKVLNKLVAARYFHKVFGVLPPSEKGSVDCRGIVLAKMGELKGNPIAYEDAKWLAELWFPTSLSD